MALVYITVAHEKQLQETRELPPPKPKDNFGHPLLFGLDSPQPVPPHEGRRKPRPRAVPYPVGERSSPHDAPAIDVASGGPHRSPTTTPAQSVHRAVVRAELGFPRQAVSTLGSGYAQSLHP